MYIIDCYTADVYCHMPLMVMATSFRLIKDAIKKIQQNAHVVHLHVCISVCHDVNNSS